MDLSVSSDTIDYLFSSTAGSSQANFDALSGTILGQGIDYFQDEKYNQAINAFKRSAALSPFSDNSMKAYDYIGQSYLKQEKTEEAIKTYKEAIRLFPTDDSFHKALGDIYLKEEMKDEALKEYQEAVNLNPNDAETRYSLGQSYITADDLDKAKEQFTEVVRITPNSAAGYYGLGQVARASGDLSDAVIQLTKAIRANKDFELAYVELGYTYADQGEMQKANDQLTILEKKNSNKATALSNYIPQVTQPRIMAAYSTDGFPTTAGPGTNVSTLSARLADANQSKLFSMNIAFSKDMDQASIINPYNWTISRATIQNNGGIYNNGIPISSKEAVILPFPASVIYDSETNKATVNFWISQNASADATIDPSHIVFKFCGVDAYGKAMDISADEYSGFSKIA